MHHRHRPRSAALVPGTVAALLLLGTTACGGEDAGVEAVRAEQGDDGTAEPPDGTDASEAEDDGPLPSDDTGDGSTGTSGTVDPCALLTVDEIGAAIARTVAAGSAGTLYLGPSCGWVVSDTPPTADQSEDLRVDVAVGDLDDERRAEIDALVAAPETITIPGLGDLAVVENGRIPGPVFVVLGDRFLFLDISNFFQPFDFESDEVLVAAYTQLATLAVGRV